MYVKDFMDPVSIVALNHERIRDICLKFSQIADEEIPVVDDKNRLLGVISKTNLFKKIHYLDSLDNGLNDLIEELQPSDITYENSTIYNNSPKCPWVINDDDILVGKLSFSRIKHDYNVYTFHEIELDFKKWLSGPIGSFFLLILESSYDGVWISDSVGNTLYVNSAYERMSGFSREIVLNKNMKEFVEKNVCEQSAVLLAIEQKKTITITHKYITGISALATANPVLDENGNILSVICNVRDLSKLLKLKKELAIARQYSAKYCSELMEYRQQLQKEFNFKSESIRTVLNLAEKAALFDSTVLILGETGVGKEVLAKFIHTHSPRKNGPFIKINCAAIPHELAESEFFGYVRGSFTGANLQGKPGIFELANTGTLFLDEISECPLGIQAKLLRVLQDKEIFKLGDKKPIKVDVRVVAATNRNLAELVQQKRFREDLYYRLSVIPITIPPLKDRKEDILSLTYHFLEQLNIRYKKKKAISSKVINVFCNYHWPGNVRELENLMEYLFVISSDEIILENIPHQLLIDSALATKPSGYLKQSLEQFEKRIIASTIEDNGSVRKTAKALGIDPATLSRKIKKYQITVDEDELL
ncbi:sigma 54-interacting transcriptional regulator [Candidatus Formimonas warabiya]|uniref:Uncharacterized protein n=1 Tax=Formimonas warabiya TaxID=1761012 RepID=A0A3G1KVV2_FORW1|nr:sigma 54-interacting transcriptional regulator [Candidatus Formimonas warabiya]ATW26604.1 hypothetical protein DCMF_19250 [Candidatus Formimonas warabiya]